MADEPASAPKSTPCPICRRPAQPGVRPFCSARCQQVDLGRWLTGGYAIPATPSDGDDPELE